MDVADAVIVTVGCGAVCCGAGAGAGGGGATFFLQAPTYASTDSIPAKSITLRIVLLCIQILLRALGCASRNRSGPVYLAQFKQGHHCCNQFKNRIAVLKLHLLTQPHPGQPKTVCDGTKVITSATV